MQEFGLFFQKIICIHAKNTDTNEVEHTQSAGSQRADNEWTGNERIPKRYRTDTEETPKIYRGYTEPIPKIYRSYDGVITIIAR